MVTFDPIPQARIVRHAGHLVVPPQAHVTAAAGLGYLRTVLVYAVGLWPLTCVMLLVAGLLVLTAHLGAP